MGTVIPLKKEINNSYLELKNLVESKLDNVSLLIKNKLASEINLIHKMTDYHLNSGGKRIRPLLTLAASRLCGYENGNRDINLAACIELIHSATLLHDDVIDSSDLRRGIKTTNSIWGNQSSILVGDYLFSRCFEMMVEDGSSEILKLLSSTSSTIAQGEVLQLEYKGEIDVLEETYFNIINMKTAALFSAATRVGACITNKNKKEKDALESYGKNLGLAFQIADDALDYYSNPKVFGKEIEGYSKLVPYDVQKHFGILWDDIFMEEPNIMSNKGIILKTFKILNEKKENLIDLLRFVSTIDVYNSLSNLLFNE